MEGKDALVLRLIHEKSDLSDTDIKNFSGYLIDAKENELRKIIASVRSKEKTASKKMLIAVLGRDDAFNRRIVETVKINFLVCPERFWNDKQDSLKQRDSGLNHIVAKEAVKKNIVIVIDFSYLNSEVFGKKEKALLLARAIQNIRICRKAHCAIKIATFAERKEQLRSERELKAFLFSLGASSQQVSDAMNFDYHKNVQR